MTGVLSFDSLFNAFVTLLVTIDPPGLAPIFLALTTGMSRAERGQVALRGSVTAFALLVGFAVLGRAVLDIFGISIGAFRVAGGLLLFWIAFEMIFERRQERHERSAERAITKDMIRNIAVFPLAIPLIAGPGAISATILLSGQYASPAGIAALIAIIVLCCLACYAVFLLAERIDGLMGTTGRIILTRLLGVILSALAVQFVADGVKAIIAAG
ncbi:MAG: MarC family protein [Brucellaceae bacterium]|nr:MarC family protein [Brucellaceae bacterium]